MCFTRGIKALCIDFYFYITTLPAGNASQQLLPAIMRDLPTAYFPRGVVKGILESGFLTLAPLLLLSGGTEAAGVVTSTYDYGTMTFSLVILQASLKVSQ